MQTTKKEKKNDDAVDDKREMLGKDAAADAAYLK